MSESGGIQAFAAEVLQARGVDWEDISESRGIGSLICGLAATRVVQSRGVGLIGGPNPGCRSPEVYRQSLQSQGISSPEPWARKVGAAGSAHLRQGTGPPGRRV